MSILNFVSQDDLDDLDEDARLAFVTLTNKAQQSLSIQLAQFPSDDPNLQYEREELRHSFMNVIVATAASLEIEPFSLTIVPPLPGFGYQDYQAFRTELDHYITQILLDNSIRGKRDTIAILPNTKDKIRTYLRALRDCLEQSTLSDAKREVLLKRLDDFEVELEKRRINILAVARLAFELLAVPGGLWSSVEVAHKLVHNVTLVFAEAKSAEQEAKQLSPPSPPKALSPPRRSHNPSAPHKAPQTAGRMREIIDDDIPF